MKSFFLFENDIAADILCEEQALSGVRRVAGILADDIFAVTIKKPNISDSLSGCSTENAIIVATLGHSSWADTLIERGVVDPSPISGKRECYMIKVIDAPFEEFTNIKQALVIIGNDKRGTIYGMFHLSELCGVSPLVFWGDAAPAKQHFVQLTFENDIISKEPSVKYRGFFINDEWPAFGKWCTEHYGDVNAHAYDMVFQLLLRLKGNYLWPAMWNSSFSEDGPGIDSARLADEYGVIMGASHHEPMCRAGVEWQQQYKNYGDDNAWSFISNSKAITEFWKDGIIRNKDFENIITIGMRGENDSHLMGENATIQDNVNVLKSAITVQNRLIRENINPNLKEVPRMFAIYKEVEDFYFGIEGDGGLRGWDELEDVILLFSEDNHGSLRAIPQINEKRHSGGYGIYYHFDYHGGPTSYEWLNHINPVRAWEQLTMAYEYGIRDMWIVNVGDIKGNEYPLNYLMDLAYDYEKWGITNLNSAAQYREQWVEKQFGDTVYDEQIPQLYELMDSYFMWSSVRIPESLFPDVFRNNFHELENTFDTINKIMIQADILRNALADRALVAFESMIFFPAMAFFSSLLINLAAGLNYLHADRGTYITNKYAKQLEDTLPKDRFYVNKFNKLLNGKWKHMMDSAHMGFKTWDANDWTYPLIKTMVPIPQPKIVVSFRGFEPYNLGHHWQDKVIICNSEMTRPDVNEITIDIDSRGDVDFSYAITCDKPWLSFSLTSGKTYLKEVPRISIQAFCDRTVLKGDDTATIHIGFGFKDGDKGQAFLYVQACNTDFSTHHGAFVEAQDYVCINAENFSYKSDVESAGWRVVPRLGRVGNAIKPFPVTKSWVNERVRPPYVSYDFVIRRSEEYIVTFYLSPRNPMVKGGTMKGCFSVNSNPSQFFDVVSPDIVTNDTDPDWSYGATNNIRKVSIPVSLVQGHNNLKFYAANPNVLLENIVVHSKVRPLPETHLAPPESYRVL